LNQQVPELNLSFYVSKHKLLADEKQNKKKPKDDDQGFVEFEVKLAGLRADISHQFRQRHYTDAVRALIDSLDSAAMRVEESDGKTTADKIGMNDFRHQFAMNAQSEQLTKRPERMEKKLARLTAERRMEQIATKHGSLVAE